MNYEKLIKDHEKLIWKLTNNFYNVDKSDLFQAGVIGLLKAYKNYKRDGNTKFSSYAHDYIFGEMYILSNNKNIKVSKDLLRLYKNIEKTRYTLAQKINKIPSNLELSEYLNIPLDLINSAINSSKEIMSLDNSEVNIYDTYGKLEDYDTKILIEEGLNTLTDDEKSIIKKRYFEDLTQSEVARKLKMTQVMVSRYEKKGINKLRNYITM